jgi:hypothetical protein
MNKFSALAARRNDIRNIKTIDEVVEARIETQGDWIEDKLTFDQFWALDEMILAKAASVLTRVAYEALEAGEFPKWRFADFHGTLNGHPSLMVQNLLYYKGPVLDPLHDSLKRLDATLNGTCVTWNIVGLNSHPVLPEAPVEAEAA